MFHNPRWNKSLKKVCLTCASTAGEAKFSCHLQPFCHNNRLPHTGNLWFLQNSLDIQQQVSSCFCLPAVVGHSCSFSVHDDDQSLVFQWIAKRKHSHNAVPQAHVLHPVVTNSSDDESLQIAKQSNAVLLLLLKLEDMLDWTKSAMLFCVNARRKQFIVIVTSGQCMVWEFIEMQVIH